jgi:Zn-dependent protease/CBS domain-containing protein
MLWSIPIGVVAGTVVRLHVTFLLFLVWIGAARWRVGGQAAALEGVLFIVLIFACVLAHEFGHIVAARRYGIRTPEVTLWPIGGVASLERIPEKPSEELVVALAGPAVNVVIAAALLLYLGLSIDGAAMTELENPRASLLARVAAANIFLVVFNLIPAFPMDGGRVLRALLAMRSGRAEATRVAARIGQGAAFLFALAGLFWNPMLIVIGLFVYLAATAEAQHVAFHDGTRGLSVREGMMSAVETLPPGATLDDAVNLLIRTAQKEFPVVDGGGRPRGLLTKDGLIRALREAGPGAPVLDVMEQQVPTLPSWRPLDAGLAMLNQSKAAALLIVDDAGRLVGLLTPENVGEMMLVRSVRPDFRFRRVRAAA